jgi:hypothetical protein
MNKKAKREYMRKYMRKYYKKHKAKIKKQRAAILRQRISREEIKARKALHREKPAHESPTLPANKTHPKRLFREKIQIPLSENQGTPVPKGPWSPTCLRCGLLNLDPSRPCRRCGPGSENHLPPSPPQSERRPSGRPTNPILLTEDENDKIVAEEAGF